MQGLRDAGLAAYKAAHAKDQDKILDAADAISAASANCPDEPCEKPTSPTDASRNHADALLTLPAKDSPIRWISTPCSAIASGVEQK